MIISKLVGGLGNQLFQYAIGRSLALRLGTEFFYDASAFQNYRVHQLSIQHLRIEAKPLPESRSGLWGRVRDRLERRGWLPSKLKIKPEATFTYDPTFPEWGDQLKLDGYWQTEKYFIGIRDQLLKEFTPVKPLSNYSAALAKEIQGSEGAVSLHIRRGDYLSNPDALKFHGLTPLDFYEKCLAELAPEVPNLHLFIFSDDPVWVKEQLKTSHPMTFVDQNGDRNYEDLHLMSLCKHNIIANSTFSWWGAWLNQNPSKIVFAPKIWFASGAHDDRDLIPAVWRRR